MPAGCDFICDNKECEHNGKGIVMTGPWPLGNIDKIIDARNVAKMEDFRTTLIKLKTEGRNYACINYPNVNEVATEGYRIHKWCPNCPCLWTYDAMIQDNEDNKDIEETAEETIQKAIDGADLPGNCPKCETKLLTFTEVVEEGVICPFCKEKMKTSTWFSNETKEEKS